MQAHQAQAKLCRPLNLRPDISLSSSIATDHWPCRTVTQHLLAATSDRRLNIIDLPSIALKTSLTTLHDSPILSCITPKEGLLLSTSMSGQIVLSDLAGEIIDKRRDHAKYVVQVAIHQDGETTWLATAGWDAKVHIYKLATTADKLDAPIGTITLPTNPEAVLFVTHPETSEPILIVTRRDSTFLYYYSLPNTPNPDTLSLLGRQNLAPHSNAWIAFTPSAIALSPIDPTLLAVATSAVPHMKLILVRLMLPSSTDPATETLQPPPNTIVRSSLLDMAADPAAPTQASQARAALALQDREAAAILIHCTTLSPQTPYSTPALAWRPDGSGVWVNSDDGVIRGIEARSGKIVSVLRGHEPGSKIRCLCAGWVGVGEGVKEEWLVSGGFDQRLIVWRPEK